MAEVKTVRAVPNTTDELFRMADKSDFEYVDIPKKDSRGYEYPDIRLNRLVFEAGKKHFVHPVLAAQIRDRMKAFEGSVLRSLLSTQHEASIRQSGGTPV
jgi:hypothetical protein